MIKSRLIGLLFSLPLCFIHCSKHLTFNPETNASVTSGKYKYGSKILNLKDSGEMVSCISDSDSTVEKGNWKYANHILETDVFQISVFKGGVLIRSVDNTTPVKVEYRITSVTEFGFHQSLCDGNASCVDAVYLKDEAPAGACN